MPGPKSGEKGFPSAGDVGDAAATGRCADVAAGILQSAGDLCGVLVVAVVAPLCGDGSARSRGSSPQRLAVDELRRLVDQRQQQEGLQTEQSQQAQQNAQSQHQAASAPAGSTTVPSGKTATA